jgi:hypothetical protein
MDKGLEGRIVTGRLSCLGLCNLALYCVIFCLCSKRKDKDNVTLDSRKPYNG